MHQGKPLLLMSHDHMQFQESMGRNQQASFPGKQKGSRFINNNNSNIQVVLILTDLNSALCCEKQSELYRDRQ